MQLGNYRKHYMYLEMFSSASALDSHYQLQHWIPTTASDSQWTAIQLIFP